MIAVIQRRPGFDRAVIELDIVAELDRILLRAPFGKAILIEHDRHQNQHLLLRHDNASGFGLEPLCAGFFALGG